MEFVLRLTRKQSWANPEMSAMIDLARHASDHIGSIQ
jgi:hypothetical protein